MNDGMSACGGDFNRSTQHLVELTQCARRPLADGDRIDNLSQSALRGPWYFGKPVTSQTFHPGDTTGENGKTVHWHRNDGKDAVILITADIFKTTK